MNRHSSKNRIVPAVEQHKQLQDSIMYNYSLFRRSLHRFCVVVSDVVTIERYLSSERINKMTGVSRRTVPEFELS